MIVDFFCRPWSFRHCEFDERPHCGLVRMRMVKRPVVEPVLLRRDTALLSSGTHVLYARVEHTGLLSLSRGGRVSTFLRTLFRLHRHQHVFLATRHRTRTPAKRSSHPHFAQLARPVTLRTGTVATAVIFSRIPACDERGDL